MWFERPSGPGEFEVQLPFGLRDLALNAHPEGSGPIEALEIREVGALEASTRRAVHKVERLERRLLDSSRMTDADRALQLTGDYRDWLSAYESPSSISRAVLAQRARRSGLSGTLLLDPAEPEELLRPSGTHGGLQVVRRLEDVRGDFVVTVPAGASLVEHAGDAIACAFADHPDAQVLHADEDVLQRSGRRASPSFKPSFSPELLRARNYLDGLVAYRRSILPRDRRGTLDRAARYQLLLELSAEARPGAFHRLPAVLASRVERQTDGVDERRLLSEHLARRGIQCDIEDGLVPGARWVRYRLPDPAPRVSIIVPTRNAGRLVDTCVRSVHRLTAYPSFEIVLVDNGSDESASLAIFARLADEGLVRIARDPSPFNYPSLNNRASSGVSAPILCLLNNDVEALHADWLEEMVGIALQPGVGAVGAKLFYPDGRIQHGGVLVGCSGNADHLYARAAGDAHGLDDQLLVRRETSAVTAACLVIRRDLYQQVGGLDERTFPVAYNDVDFCLKLRELGLRNIWTPHARLIHHESATRGAPVTPAQLARLERETAALQTRWHTETFEDPYHSPNLSRDHVVPLLAFPPRRRPWSAGCGS